MSSCVVAPRRRLKEANEKLVAEQDKHRKEERLMISAVYEVITHIPAMCTLWCMCLVVLCAVLCCVVPVIIFIVIVVVSL